MSASTTLEQLAEAWSAKPPAPAAAEAVGELPKQRFGAYEVPTTLIPRSDYETDEDIVPGDLWKLFLITDPNTVKGLISPAAFDVGDSPLAPGENLRASSPMDWAEIFGNFQGEILPVDEIGFRLFTALVGNGAALGVVLESRDSEIADGFKIYGPSDRLADILIGHIGWEKYRVSEKNPWGVAVGDIRDEDFARYLRAANAEGLLHPTIRDS